MPGGSSDIINDLRTRFCDAKPTWTRRPSCSTASRGWTPASSTTRTCSGPSGTHGHQPVRVAVLHHPVSPLPPAEVATLAGLINAGQVKEVLLAKGFALVLHGHVHTGWFAREQWPGQHGDWRTLHIAAAPTLGSRESLEQHGYNEVEVVREQDHYEVCVRRVRPRRRAVDAQGRDGLLLLVPGRRRRGRLRPLTARVPSLSAAEGLHLAEPPPMR